MGKLSTVTSSAVVRHKTWLHL